jgi:major membrane immunogen (membrane-anchored lipoprotein)
MKTYAPRLIEKQALADVDSVTGATWARGKFQEALIAVLQKAKK